jgi:MULE transposase domain
MLCFLSGEKDEDYEWAMTQFKDVLERNVIPPPLSTVTDRELALMNAIEIVLPKVVHLLCT